MSAVRKVVIGTGFPPVGFRAPDGKTKVRVFRGGYTDAVAREVCKRLMNMQSITKICADPQMPSNATIHKWLLQPQYAEFREIYYYARRIGAEMRVDQIFEIADDTEHDWKETFNKNGEPNGWKPNNEAIQRSKLKIDTIKWYAAKMVPKIYGEKLDVQHDVTGDLADLMRDASNNDRGLPKPIDVEGEVVDG